MVWDVWTCRHRRLPQPKLEMVRSQCHTLEMALEEVTIIIRQLLPSAVGTEVVAHRRNDERLDLGRRDAADRIRPRGAFPAARLERRSNGSGHRPCWCGSGSCSGRECQTAGRSGARGSRAAGSAAQPLGRQACPALPQTAPTREWAHGRRGEPRPGKQPRRYRSGS